ncbi:MAG: ammonia channel protein, partial [Chloroflexota bacterium]|nr:ammonia channel protein [Chloroflexota bacterium]
FILWFGWFGFNAGSELAADGIAANAFLTTNTAAALAALTWLVISGLHTGKMSAVGAATGAVAGLVAITPACGWVDVGGALMIGMTVSIVCYLSAMGMEKSGIDDALVVFGVHGVGGAWGALMTGVFASEAIGGVKGLIEGNGVIVLEQLIGILATFAYSAIVTFIILKILDVIPGLGLQESEENELGGLDVNVHGERGYIADGAD